MAGRWSMAAVGPATLPRPGTVARRPAGPRTTTQAAVEQRLVLDGVSVVGRARSARRGGRVRTDMRCHTAG